MMITRGRRCTSVSFSRSFLYHDDSGAGFGFDCDESGHVDVTALNPIARESYAACLSGVVHGRPIRDDGVVRYEHSWWEPGRLKCECKHEVVLRGFTNTCECGRDYNSAGQLLGPRELWGEETGEPLSEILSIP